MFSLESLTEKVTVLNKYLSADFPHTELTGTLIGYCAIEWAHGT